MTGIVDDVIRARKGDLSTGDLLGLMLTVVLLVLFASAAFLVWIAPRAVAVPHPLFYVISVALPYHWRAGFVLVPFVTLICGLLGTASRRKRTAG